MLVNIFRLMLSYMESLCKFWDKVWPALVLVGFWGGIILIPIIKDRDTTTENSSDSYYSAPADDTSDSESSYTDSRSSDECTSDCSGHDAGYEWGEENDICDTDYDNGNSESFNEGVRAWAEDNCEDTYDTSDSRYEY